MHALNQVSLAAEASGEPEFREIGLGPRSETHPGELRLDDPTSSNYDGRFGSVLLNDGDRRNTLDRYRYWTVAVIEADLDARGRHDFEVVAENWTHDFNVGSMVRIANASQTKCIHIIGPHKWGRKGVLMTELYRHIEYHSPIAELVESWNHRTAGEIAYEQAKADTVAVHVYDVAVDGDNGHLHELLTGVDARDTRIKKFRAARVITLDIIPSAMPMEAYAFPKRCLLLFGVEDPGLSEKVLALTDDVVYISQFGSARSINTGAVAVVAMHAWTAQHAVSGVQPCVDDPAVWIGGLIVTREADIE